MDCSFSELATVTGNILGWASIWRPVLRQFSRPGIFASNEVVIKKNVRKGEIPASWYLLVGMGIIFSMTLLKNRAKRHSTTPRHTVIVKRKQTGY